MSLGWIKVSSSGMSVIIWGNHLGPRDGAAVRRCQLDRADPGQAQEARGNTHPAHILPGKKSVWSHCFERCLVWSVFICHVIRRVLSKRFFIESWTERSKRSSFIVFHACKKKSCKKQGILLALLFIACNFIFTPREEYFGESEFAKSMYLISRSAGGAWPSSGTSSPTSLTGGSSQSPWYSGQPSRVSYSSKKYWVVFSSKREFKY